MIFVTSPICDSMRAFAVRTSSHAPSPLTETTIATITAAIGNMI
jgi:hypothetical protein